MFDSIEDRAKVILLASIIRYSPGVSALNCIRILRGTVSVGDVQSSIQETDSKVGALAVYARGHNSIYLLSQNQQS